MKFQILFSKKNKIKIFQNVCRNFYPVCKGLRIVDVIEVCSVDQGK